MSTGNTEQYDGTLREARDDLAAPPRRGSAPRRGTHRAESRWVVILRPLQDSRGLAWVLVAVSVLCLLARAAQVYRIFVPFTPSAPVDPSFDATGTDSSPYSTVLSIGQSFSYAPSGGDPTPWAMTALLVLVLASGGPYLSASSRAAAPDDLIERVVTVLAAVGALAGALTLAVALWWVATTGGVVSTQVVLQSSSGSFFFIDPVGALVQAGVPGVVSMGLGLTVIGLQRSRADASGAAMSPAALASSAASATSADAAAPAAVKAPSPQGAVSPTPATVGAQPPGPEALDTPKPDIAALDPAAFRRPGAAPAKTGSTPDAQVGASGPTASSGPAEDPFRRPGRSR